MAYGLRQVATRRALDPHLTVDPAHTSFVRECHHPITHTTRSHALGDAPAATGLTSATRRRGVARVAWRCACGVAYVLGGQAYLPDSTCYAGFRGGPHPHRLRAVVCVRGVRVCVVCCAHSGAHTQTLVYTPVYALAYRYVVSASMNGVTGQRRRRHAALAPAPQHTIIMPPCPMPNGRGGARQVVHAATAAARRLNQ